MYRQSNKNNSTIQIFNFYNQLDSFRIHDMNWQYDLQLTLGDMPCCSEALRELESKLNSSRCNGGGFPRQDREPWPCLSRTIEVKSKVQEEAKLNFGKASPYRNEVSSRR